MSRGPTHAARLLLIRHATTAATRRALFPHTTGALPLPECEPLDRAGAAAADALRTHVDAPARCWTSHALRSKQTAQRLGFDFEADGSWAEASFGRWAGLSLEQVQVEEPAALAAWFEDPGSAPHGGETLAQVRARARALLGKAAALAGTTVVVTHGGLIKAALLEALGLPNPALWQLEAAPCSVAELQGGSPRWRLARLNWTPQLDSVSAHHRTHGTLRDAG